MKNATFCLVAGFSATVIVLLAIFGLRWIERWHEEASSRDRWESQIAKVKAGQTTTIIWPEPRFLVGVVRDQPDVAAKIRTVEFCVGKVSDERFGYLKQFPQLQEIDFDEVWEGSDAFLKRIAGMESITSLSFYQTGVTEDGVRAVASFPHLKRLKLDYFWKNVSLEPLRSHKGIETIELEELPLTKEWIEVMASLPKLRELVLEGEPITESDLLNLHKALPNVKVERGK